MQKVMPVMVSFFTHGWIQQCVQCFQRCLPELKIVVIDNNPTSFKQMENWGFPWNPLRNPFPKWRSLFKFALAERDWLNKQNNVILLDNKVNYQLSHAQGLSLAFDYCKKEEIDIMLTLDPDCFFESTEWFYNLLQPIIAEDMWMTVQSEVVLFVPTASYKKFYGLQIPYMQRVNKMQWSFEEGVRDNNYYDCMAWTYWQCKKNQKTKFVDKGKFIHYKGGSYKNIVNNKRNCPLVTFL